MGGAGETVGRLSAVLGGWRRCWGDDKDIEKLWEDGEGPGEGVKRPGEDVEVG